MSFGVSISDFIAVADLTKKAVTRFKSAPRDFQEAADTVQSLDVLLDTIHDEVRSKTSVFQHDPSKAEHFNFLISLCIAPLTRLDGILSKFESLGTDKVRILDRLRFSKSTVQDIQRQLALRYQNLQSFLETLGLGRIEGKVDGLRRQQVLILEAIDRLTVGVQWTHDAGSLLSDRSNDDKSVWKQLRRDLNSAGFKSADIERHKTLIFNKLVDLKRSGIIEWDDVSVADDRSDSTVLFLAHGRQNYRPPTVESVLDDSEEDTAYYDRCGPSTQRRHSTYRVPSPERRASSPKSRAAGVSRDRAKSSSEIYAEGRSTSGSRRGKSTEARENNRVRTASRLSNVRTNVIPEYDTNVLTGERSVRNPVWQYRRPLDNLTSLGWPIDSETIHEQLYDDRLPIAASIGDTEKVRELLLAGHYPAAGERSRHPRRREGISRKPNYDNTSALYRAAREGHFSTAHLLLRFGADTNVVGNDQKCLVQSLASDGRCTMLRLLLEYGVDLERSGALQEAAHCGRLDAVQLLLDYGADIDASEQAGSADATKALWAKAGKEFLSLLGLRTTFESEEKHTALYRAVWQGQTAIVSFLLREGADTKFVSLGGRSALYKAVEQSDLSCTRLLLDYGADPAIGVGETYESVLSRACELGDENIVRLLLRRGAEPGIGIGQYVPTVGPPWRHNPVFRELYPGMFADHDGGGHEYRLKRAAQLIPLHIVAKTGNVKVAELLLIYGADQNARDYRGRIARYIALENGHDDVVHLLDAYRDKAAYETSKTQ